MRDCTVGFTIEETKAALREVAIFHAVSWAMQAHQGVPLYTKWDFSYRPKKAASAYKVRSMTPNFNRFSVLTKLYLV